MTLVAREILSWNARAASENFLYNEIAEIVCGGPNIVIVGSQVDVEIDE